MKKAVLGIGNPLLGDDSVGLLALKALLGCGADLVDFGWGMDVGLLKRYDTVAVVDAGLFGGKPGEVKECCLDELSPSQTSSTHGVNLVFLLKGLGNPVRRLRFFLVQPASSMRVTDEVKKAIPEVARRVRTFLQDDVVA